MWKKFLKLKLCRVAPRRESYSCYCYFFIHLADAKIYYPKNSRMTKAEIVNEISRSTGIEKVTVLKTVESFMVTVSDSLVDGSNVYLRGFGSFEVKKRAEKTARNISKNTSIIIPAHNIPAFKPAKAFIAKVKLANSDN